MARRGGSFGILILVVTLAVVLMLVAKHWQSVAPAAGAVIGAGGGDARFDDRGQTGAGDAVRSGELPDLRDMQSSTDAHANRVREAMESID